MNRDGFDFIVDSLFCKKLESKICEHYELGNAHDSSFPIELKQDMSISFLINAEQGSVSGRLTPHRAVSGQYIVTVHSADVSMKEISADI